MEYIVTYEQALDLEKLGFKEKCPTHYTSEGVLGESGVGAPFIWQVLEWIEKEKGIVIHPFYDTNLKWRCFLTYLSSKRTKETFKICSSMKEALSFGISWVLYELG